MLRGKNLPHVGVLTPILSPLLVLAVSTYLIVAPVLATHFDLVSRQSNPCAGFSAAEAKFCGQDTLAGSSTKPAKTSTVLLTASNVAPPPTFPTGPSVPPPPAPPRPPPPPPSRPPPTPPPPSPPSPPPPPPPTPSPPSPTLATPQVPVASTAVGASTTSSPTPPIDTTPTDFGTNKATPAPPEPLPTTPVPAPVRTAGALDSKVQTGWAAVAGVAVVLMLVRGMGL
ncbi:hypothetical protein M427DRAFT_29577 [Gonapodya prolifera JEL478]|uniref:Uncharacterized protein n=1 Tax=Gonapodya prolifera (strain JEL478) TaxID=1344416 RepID=A0A139APN2_GONPJ|nr:hypothetical protein M427DRAFT_29577 [Gonapodya prolifera JEL478]|eukprot:KXS18678.1 hypothetical protein M427DRAFT_29577 [Gonapodya prolifera JEL478]